MTNEVAYFAIVRDGETADSPSGLARRTHTPEGRLDETLRHDLTWQRDSAIYEWERGEELGVDLVAISEQEAEELIARFRERWGREG
jgi:hypothetical protein